MTLFLDVKGAAAPLPVNKGGRVGSWRLSTGGLSGRPWQPGRSRSASAGSHPMTFGGRIVGADSRRRTVLQAGGGGPPEMRHQTQQPGLVVQDLGRIHSPRGAADGTASGGRTCSGCLKGEWFGPAGATSSASAAQVSRPRKERLCPRTRGVPYPGYGPAKTSIFVGSRLGESHVLASFFLNCL